jgi:hypothetical protein
MPSGEHRLRQVFQRRRRVEQKHAMVVVLRLKSGPRKRGRGVGKLRAELVLVRWSHARFSLPPATGQWMNRAA